ncbi:hypothetical protein [Maribacter sp. 2-571]|uniref:hypothetical protein n=1 Tax=Maribacter sp. 2-571 TaxID=3417569 RepID=UPI003D32938A
MGSFEVSVMNKKFIGVIAIFTFWGLLAQEESVPDFIYKDWVLVTQESDQDFLVYSDEDEFWLHDIPYDSSNNLNLKSSDGVLSLEFIGPRKTGRRCGNYRSTYSQRREYWKKSTWKIHNVRDTMFLVLEYFTAEKGKKYVSTKKETFQVLTLEKNRLVLQKLPVDL